jgi:hypothetical protein
MNILTSKNFTNHTLAQVYSLILQAKRERKTRATVPAVTLAKDEQSTQAGQSLESSLPENNVINNGEPKPSAL